MRFITGGQNSKKSEVDAMLATRRSMMAAMAGGRMPLSGAATLKTQAEAQGYPLTAGSS